MLGDRGHLRAMWLLLFAAAADKTLKCRGQSVEAPEGSDFSFQLMSRLVGPGGLYSREIAPGR